MKKRKQIIVDKGFQVKTTFSVIGIVSILSVIIVAAISAVSLYNNNKIHNIYQIEDQVFQALYARSMFPAIEQGSQNSAPAMDKGLMEMEKNHFLNMETLNEIITYNRYLLFALIAFVIFQGTVLYMLLIRKTHRISGPIYVMSMYIRQILDGKMPTPRKLREKDEFKDFYDLFVQLVDKYKEKVGQ